MDDAEPALLLVEDEYDELATATLAEARHAPERRRLGDLGDGGAPVPGDVADDDGLLLVYTSGTTGKPKGAVSRMRTATGRTSASTSRRA